MVEVQPFGRYWRSDARPTGSDGRAATLYTLSSDSITVRVMDLGATIVGIEAPGRDGIRADVTLGFDDAASYYPTAHGTYFGMTIGPSANRVAGGRVPIEGRAYRLPPNEGPNNLHTDPLLGLHARRWDAEIDPDADAVTFTVAVCEDLSEFSWHEDGEERRGGLPGNRAFRVRYELEGSCLRTTMSATTDAPTFINLTNHSYFNLAGEGTGTVLEQELEIFAERFLPIDGASLPTGELRPVAGTPFDFRAPKPIGRDIASADGQLACGNGYDHCFCIDGYDVADPLVPRRAVRALDPASGRGMELWTTLPGVQLYTGNFVPACDGADAPCGKAGHVYGARSGFALEPQFYPATPSHPEFPCAIFTTERPYRAVTEYRFFTA